MKIILAINSKDPNYVWLDTLIKSAKGFDEILLYIDSVDATPECKKDMLERTPSVKIINDGKSRSIAEGFNHVVSQAEGDWICSFCDDDYFKESALANLLSLIRSGTLDDADIVHFPVLTGDGRWGDHPSITFEELKNYNMLPHGSFFRKKVFDAIGGYQVDAGADWDFFLRAAKKGFVFRYYSEPVYFFRMGHERSAWNKQVRELGTNEIKRRILENVERS